MATPSSTWVRTLRILAFLSLAVALVSLGAQRWEWLTGAGLAALVFFGLLALERVNSPVASSSASPVSPAIEVKKASADLESPTRSDAPPAYANLTPAPTVEDDEDVEDEEEEEPLPPSQRLFIAVDEGMSAGEADAIVSGLVTEGADLTETDDDGNNVLEFAVLQRAEFPVVKALVAAGARLSKETEVLSQVLADNPSEEEVKLLLAHGGSANDPSSSWESLVEQALRDEVEDRVVIALLETKPTFTTDVDDRDWAFVCIDSDRSASLLSAILESAAAIGQPIDKTASLLLAFSKEDYASMAVLLAAGASAFEYDEAEDTSLVRIALENDDRQSLFLLALACVGTDRYRLLGWAEASTDLSDMHGFQRWTNILVMLEQKWAQGYGDPLQPAAYADGTAGDALNQSLLTTTDLVQAQQLLLAGANPFWSPSNGKPSAFEQACRRRDGSFVAMLLEAESQSEAEFRLGTLEKPDSAWVEVARAELALRRFAREKASGN